jgi:hypothetical protein
VRDAPTIATDLGLKNFSKAISVDNLSEHKREFLKVKYLTSYQGDLQSFLKLAVIFGEAPP